MKNKKSSKFRRLFIAVFICFSVVVITPSPVLAQTSIIESLQRQLGELMRQIQELQTKVQEMTRRPSEPTPTVPTPAPANFVTLEELPGSPRVSCILPELRQGQRHNSVYLLQMLLNRSGNYPEGLITGFYGPLTRAAVERFQRVMDGHFFDIPVIDGSAITGATREALNGTMGQHFPECGRPDPAPEHISFTSPSGGETWRVGDTNIISWHPALPSGVSEKWAVINLHRSDGTLVGNITPDIGPRTGDSSFRWDTKSLYLRQGLTNPPSSGQYYIEMIYHVSQPDGTMERFETRSNVFRIVLEDERIQIIVDTPTANQVIKSPVLVSGRSNTFEANVRIRIKDNNGRILANTHTMGGTVGEFRPFSKSVSYSSSFVDRGVIEVFEDSPMDGSEINKITIPVIFVDTPTPVEPGILNFRLSPTTPQSRNVELGEKGVLFTSIEVTASHGPVRISGIVVGGAGPTDVSRIIVEDGHFVLGEVIPDETNLSGVYKIDFSNPYVVQAGTTKTISIYADITTRSDSVGNRFRIGVERFDSNARGGNVGWVHGNMMTIVADEIPKTTITSPSAGTTWTIGENNTIRWNPPLPEEVEKDWHVLWLLRKRDNVLMGVIPGGSNLKSGQSSIAWDTKNLIWSAGISEIDEGRYWLRLIHPIRKPDGSIGYGDAIESEIFTIKSDKDFSEFSVSPVSGPAPLAVTATFDQGSSCSEYTLTWGDGTNSSFRPDPNLACPQVVVPGVQKTHTYTKPGTYTVTFQQGGWPAEKITVTVTEPETYSTTLNIPPKEWVYISIPIKEGLDVQKIKNCDSRAAIYKFNGAYRAVESSTLQPGVGYTLRLPSAESTCRISFSGTPYLLEGIKIRKGQNLIGSSYKTQSLNEITGTCDPNLIILKGGLSQSVVNTLEPLKSYWFGYEGDEECVLWSALEGAPPLIPLEAGANLRSISDQLASISESVSALVEGVRGFLGR